MRRRQLVLFTMAVLLATFGAVSFAAGPAAADPTQTNYSLGVLVLKYFPLTANGQNININVTGDVGDPLSTMRTKTDSITTNAITALQQGSAYHKYANAAATPSLSYHVVDTHEYDTAVPTVANPAYNPPSNPYAVRPNYPSIMTAVNICNYVQNLGVNEIWMYAYQGPSQLQIDESKMSGPNGDYSNEWYHDSLPVCTKTYTLMTFNYGRGTAEAVHSHGHQLEAEMNAVDSTLFSTDFEGLNYPGGTTTVGRCGSVHNPPNATSEYDWANSTAHASDCLNWNPNGLGSTTQVSCANWGCSDLSDTNNAQLNWQVYWMQNFPGKGNTVTYGGRPVRNWWDVHGEWDHIISSDRTLTLPPPALACHVVYTRSQWTGGFTANLTVTNNGTTAITGWTLGFTFPGDQHITSSWNGTAVQTGATVAMTGTTTITPGGSVNPGFQGTWTTSDANPTAFTVNGSACV